MALQSTYRGIEFICEAKDQSDLLTWYDNLGKSEVKSSITKVKCSDYQPYEQVSFRVIVLCNHPFANGALSFAANDDTLINCRLDALAPEFAGWIERNQMPAEVMIGDRYACIDWWPKEMAALVLNDLSPQGQSQWEIDTQLLDCLELIRLAAVSDQEFAELWRGSNEPFFAAGRLILGEFQWIREVPLGDFRSELEGEILLERVGEYSREFVGLLRLALSTGAESPLLDRAWLAIRSFNAEHEKEISRWLTFACDLLDQSDEMLRVAKNHFAEYAEIDEACDRLRHELVDATRGLEDELITVLNAVLPTLEAPQSSICFTDEQDHQLSRAPKISSSNPDVGVT